MSDFLREQLRLQTPWTGRFIKENGDAFNIADALVGISGSVEDVPANLFAAGNRITTRITTPSGLPVLSIRPTQSFTPAISTTITPFESNIFADGNCFYEIIKNGTLTGASFNAVDGNSVVESDVSATAIAGGTVISSGYVTTLGGTTKILSSYSAFGRLDLSDNDILTIVVTSFVGNISTSASLQWREQV